MLALKIENKQLEQRFMDIIKYRYNGSTEDAIEGFLELLEDFEDLVDVEVRRREESEDWEEVKKELGL